MKSEKIDYCVDSDCKGFKENPHTGLCDNFIDGVCDYWSDGICTHPRPEQEQSK